MGKIDFTKFKTPEVLVQTISNRIELRADGREYKALCPFHGDTDASFRVVPDKGFYYCFGCEAKGDAIDFVMDYDNVDFKGAAKILDDGGVVSNYSGAIRKPVSQPVDIYAGIKILPVPASQVLTENTLTPDIYNPKKLKFGKCRPSMVFPYRSLTGELIGYVIRLDFGDGVKITPTILWCELPDKTVGWSYMSFPEQKPFYGQEKLTDSTRPVLITEGEKAADAAGQLLGNIYDVVCWSGGGNAVTKANWSVMKGKKILLWPDMDDAGMKAMIGHEKDGDWKRGAGDLAIDAGAVSVRYISRDDSKPKGWDAADAIADGQCRSDVIEWAKIFVLEFVAREYSYDAEMPNHMHESPPMDIYHDVQVDEGDNGVVVVSVSDKEVNYLDMLKKKKDKQEIEPKLTHNAIILLQYHPDMFGVIAYDENSHTIDIVSRAPWDDSSAKIPRNITDSDAINTKAWLEVNDMSIGINDTRGAIISVADKRKYNPLKIFINSLDWDGVPRLNKWLHTYLGAKDNEYSSMIGRKFLIGAIARGLRPGIKMDTMLILEGEQGVMKSSAIEALFGRKFYTDEIHNLGSKDAAMQMQGMWGIEIPEMGAMSKSATEDTKAWMTRTVDRFRPPYGTTVIDSPRSCVLLGTMNTEGGYLKDATGARRFWPVMCKTVQIQDIRRDREQIWAEAKHYFGEGEKWWLTPEENEVVKLEQEDRYEGDAYSDMIDDYLCGKSEIAVSDVLSEGLDLPTGQWTKGVEMRVGKHLKLRGWSRKRTMRGGQRHYVYVRDENDNFGEF